MAQNPQDRQYNLISLGQQFRKTLKPRDAQEEEKLKLLSDADLGFAVALSSPEWMARTGAKSVDELEQQWIANSSLLGHIASSQSGLPNFQRPEVPTVRDWMDRGVAEVLPTTTHVPAQPGTLKTALQALASDSLDTAVPGLRLGRVFDESRAVAALDPNVQAAQVGFASGASSNLIPALRRGVAQHSAQSPAQAESVGSGQLAGILSQVATSLPLATGRAAAAGVGALLGGTHEAGRLELQEEVTGKDVPLLNKALGIAGQTALGGVTGYAPASIGRKIANPFVRPIAQVASGSAIGAGSNALAVGGQQLASGEALDLTTPEAIQAMKMGGAMGLGLGLGGAIADAPWELLRQRRAGPDVPDAPTPPPSPLSVSETFWQEVPKGQPVDINVGGMAMSFEAFDNVRGVGRTIHGQEIILDRIKWEAFEKARQAAPSTPIGITPEGHLQMQDGSIQLDPSKVPGDQPPLPLRVRETVTAQAPVAEMPPIRYADGDQLRLFDGQRQAAPVEEQLPLPFDDPRSPESQLAFDFFSHKATPLGPRQPMQASLPFGEVSRMPFSGGAAIGATPLRELSHTPNAGLFRKWGLLIGSAQGKKTANAVLAARMAEIDDLWMGEMKRAPGTIRLAKVVPGGPEHALTEADKWEKGFLSQGANLNAYIQLKQSPTGPGIVRAQLYPPEQAVTFPTSQHPVYVREAQMALDKAKQTFNAMPSPENRVRLEMALVNRYGTPVLQAIPETLQIAATLMATARRGGRVVEFATDPGESLRAYLSQWTKVPVQRFKGGGITVTITPRMRDDLLALGVGGVGVAAQEADPDVNIDDDLSLSVLGIPVPRVNRSLMRLLAQSVRMKDMAMGAATGAAVGGPIGGAVGAVVGPMAGSAVRKVRTPPDALWSSLDAIAKKHPHVAATLSANPLNAPAGTPREMLQAAWASVRDAAEDLGAGLRGDASGNPARSPYDGLWTFGALRKIGAPAQDALTYLQRFMRQRMDLPTLVIGQMTSTLGHLRNASDMRLFSEVTMTSRRLENYLRVVANGGTFKLEQPLAGSNLKAVDIADLIAYHQDLMGEVQKNPAVQAAWAQHQTLMRSVGEELVKRGFLDLQNMLDQPHYFREIMIRNITQVDPVTGKVTGKPLTQGSRRPIRLSGQGWAKRVKGHEGETLHDYGEVQSRYLFETLGDLHKDDLIRDLAILYDKNAIMQKYGQQGADALGSWVQFSWKAGRPPVHLPESIVAELTRQFDRIPVTDAVLGRITSTLKAQLINGTGLGYYTRNFFSDTANMFETSPVWMGQGHVGGWKQIVEAMQEIEHPGPETTRALAEGLEEGLGVGAASADIAEHTLRHPILQLLSVKPSDSLTKKVTTGALEPLRGFQFARDEFRNALERRPREILFIKTLRDLQRRDKGAFATPAHIQEAAHLTDQRMVAYSDQTDFIRQKLAGVLFPFFSWTGKMLQNRVPFMLRNGETKLQSLDRTGRIAARSILSIGVTTALWNEMMAPDAEATLDENLRRQPHILIPLGDWDGDGSDNVMYLGMSGPANAVGMLTGTANPIGRLIDVVVGREGLWDATIGESAKQIRSQWGSLLNPVLTVPVGVATNTDVRTGRPLVNENLPMKEKLWAWSRYLVTQLPPFSHMNRAAREANDPGETLGQFVYRMTLGGNMRFFEKRDLLTKAGHRDLMEAIAEGVEAHTKEELAQRYGDAPVGGVLRRKGDSVEFRPVPTKEFLKELGPSTTWMLYLYTKHGTSNPSQFTAWNAAVSDLAQQLSQEMGGTADPGDGGLTWDLVGRMAQMEQQNPAWYTIPKIVEAQEKRKKNLKGWIFGGRE